jgi:hypothetical protein
MTCVNYVHSSSTAKKWVVGGIVKLVTITPDFDSFIIVYSYIVYHI